MHVATALTPKPAGNYQGSTHSIVRTKTPVNKTILQAFEWYVAPDGKHYRRLARDIPEFARLGITSVWLPPACKGRGTQDNGFGIYDLWDLGEFNQKGTTRTKWGTFDELKTLVKLARDHNVTLYFHAVLNHKAYADETEKCRAIQCCSNDRNRTTGHVKEIRSWLGFTFPGRAGKYSDMKWHWYHFNGIDRDESTKKKAIFRILGRGKDWARDVDTENGNYDYLMYANIDHRHPQVKDELQKWSIWVTRELHLGGFVYDAVKHFSKKFLSDLCLRLAEEYEDDLHFVGEYWKNDRRILENYLSKMPKRFSLLDCPLMHNFSKASVTASFDMRRIFEGTLVASRPTNAVTLIQNHDTQPGQALALPLADYFKPLAYALILLRPGGVPTVFYGDLYGISGPDRIRGPSCDGHLGDLILVRNLYAYGPEEPYFNHAHCIGWLRKGTWDRIYGCAVVLSNAGSGMKKMFVGQRYSGEIWTDILEEVKEPVEIDLDGFGAFRCNKRSVSVYVNDKAEGRNLFGQLKGIFKIPVD